MSNDSDSAATKPAGTTNQTPADTATSEPLPRLPLRNPGLAALLAWLVPGLGHAYQGRYAKAALFAVCILGLFVWGQIMAHGHAVYYRWDHEEWRAQLLAQVGVGTLALPALLPERFRDALPKTLPRGLVDYGRMPKPDVLDDLHRNVGRRIHLASVFTVIAGLLNFLVIFDAWDGPALYALEVKHLNRRRNGNNDAPAADKSEPETAPAPAASETSTAQAAEAATA